MDVSSPSRGSVRWPVLGQATLVGLALGVLAFTGADLFLYDVEGVLAASVGLVVPLVVALAVGLWAGAPGAVSKEPPLRDRWYVAGITVGIAGVFATYWSMQDVAPQGAVPRVLLLLFLVAAPAYVLGYLLPSLLARAEQRELEAEIQEEDAQWEERVWQPVGAVVVGVLGGFALGILLAGTLLATQLGPGSLLLGTAAALILPTLQPESQVERVREQILHETESALSSIRVVEILYPARRQPERRLYVNDEEESGELVRSGAPTLAYIAAAEQWLAQVAARGETYLFLGGGAYTLPRRVAERDPEARITVVELDPEVTRVAYRFFQVRREHHIVSLHGDARVLIERQADGGGREYDRIFVDVYDGRESLPYSLVTHEAFTLLGRLLRPGGRLLFNTIGVSQGTGERRFWSTVRTLAEVFPSLALYTHLGREYPERQNVLVAAAAEPNATFPERAGTFEPWPREEWPGWAGTLVLRDLFPAPGPVEAVQEEKRGGRAAHPR
ncbi:hypothetical protein BH24GEM3_BH24GEM3_27630 [soil metagenome]